MRVPIFFPIPKVVARLDRRHSIPLGQLLTQAGARVRASGEWVQRPVILAPGATGIWKEPGDWGAVRIGVSATDSPTEIARFACAAMAYSVMDVVARESVRALPWTRLRTPPGRPRTGRAKTNAERQRAFRKRKRQA